MRIDACARARVGPTVHCASSPLVRGKGWDTGFRTHLHTPAIERHTIPNTVVKAMAPPRKSWFVCSARFPGWPHPIGRLRLRYLPGVPGHLPPHQAPPTPISALRWGQPQRPGIALHVWPVPTHTSLACSIIILQWHEQSAQDVGQGRLLQGQIRQGRRAGPARCEGWHARPCLFGFLELCLSPVTVA